jgi:hypothetical protein
VINQDIRKFAVGLLLHFMQEGNEGSHSIAHLARFPVQMCNGMTSFIAHLHICPGFQCRCAMKEVIPSHICTGNLGRFRSVAVNQENTAATVLLQSKVVTFSFNVQSGGRVPCI